MLEFTRQKNQWRRVVVFIGVILALCFVPSNLQVQSQQPTTNYSQPQRVIFLNQVRGEECCDVGSFEHLQQQVETFQEYNLPATFTIRYDALKDTKYTTYLKNLTTNNPQPTTELQLGVFLEITPSLAHAANVPYSLQPDQTTHNPQPTTSNVEKWYEAQHAYPIGYSLDDRKKLIDTVMEQFKTVFGAYPQVTTGWIVDTYSINYLREEYGVEVHQITREQWGTDSYTMSGGPVHYPYLASPNWAFLPGEVENPTTKNPIEVKNLSESKTEQPTTDNQQLALILRQTVSDPLYNYGDTTSAFTSQPNDYARDGKNIEYFKKLIDQMLNQTQNPYSLVILGLENSMAPEFQQDYQRQITHVAELMKNNSELKVQTVADFNQEYRSQWSGEEVWTIEGKDLIQTPSSNLSAPNAVFVNTPFYRARLLVKENELLLTDYRIYNNPTTQQPGMDDTYLPHPTSYIQIEDIYNSYQAQNLGYWVTPFLLDSSRFYQPAIVNASVQNRLKDTIKQVFLPEFRYRETPFLPSQNDTAVKPIAIKIIDLADHSLEWSGAEESGEKVLNFTTSAKESGQIHFSANSFTVIQPKAQQSIHFPSQQEKLPVNWQDSGKIKTLRWERDRSTMSLNIECEEPDRCTFSPSLSDDFDFATLQTEDYPYFFPEVVERPLDNQQTTLYAHNKHAIAGQNPVRFVLIPKDDQGYAVTTSLTPDVTVDPPVSDILIADQQGTNGVIFIDLVDNTIGKYEVKVKLGENIEKQQTVFFVPNCKEQPTYCVVRPHQALRYLHSMFTTKLREM